VKSRPSAHSAEILVLLPEGRLDARAAPELEKAFAALKAQGLTQIIVDFSQSSYISSSCLRIMIIQTRRLRQAGGDLKLCCLSDKIAQVFRMAGLDTIFDIFPTENQAAQAFPITPNSTDSRQEKTAGHGPAL
jgi:anti-sigma B factor antagonist